MPRTIAFLRAINVGGHTVRMQALRAHFEALGLANVETFIASGNVIFESRARDVAALARRIEAHLHAQLGFEVHTFLRSEAELAAIAGHAPFTPALCEQAGFLGVGFLSTAPDATTTRAVHALRTDSDELEVHGREVWWLCRGRQSDSTLSNAVFEKTLKQRSTVRNITTVRKLAALCADRST
jgi:uncharacterized protein (DUF1697 family)